MVRIGTCIIFLYILQPTKNMISGDKERRIYFKLSKNFRHRTIFLKLPRLALMATEGIETDRQGVTTDFDHSQFSSVLSSALSINRIVFRFDSKIQLFKDRPVERGQRANFQGPGDL